MYFFTSIISILFSTSFINSAQIVREERAEHYMFEKLKFEGHTYIVFSNRGHKEGSSIWHDLECEKCNKQMDAILHGDKEEERE